MTLVYCYKIHNFLDTFICCHLTNFIQRHKVNNIFKERNNVSYLYWKMRDLLGSCISMQFNISYKLSSGHSLCETIVSFVGTIPNNQWRGTLGDSLLKSTFILDPWLEFLRCQLPILRNTRLDLSIHSGGIQSRICQPWFFP